MNLFICLNLYFKILGVNMDSIYNEYFMRLALKNAIKAYTKDEVPVGCIIVRDTEVVASTYNTKKATKCATNHAEILAIQEASKKLDTFILDDCVMYVTLEPCLMCTGAIIQSRISKVYIGATDDTMGAFVSKIPLVKDELIYPHKIDYAFKKTISGYILKRFFRRMRKSKK